MATRYHGEPYRPVPRPALRVGDDERDAAAADLGDHFVAGRLTLDELHERLGDVFAARTRGQLRTVLSDLPGPVRTAAPPRRSSSEIPSDRAGRLAALSLLVLAMLIWLFTAYLFARHGAYTHVSPGPWRGR